MTEINTPPSSIPAEQSVLGGLMLDNEAWDQIADRVCEDDFFRRDHRLLFRAIAELASEKKPFDVVTLAEQLERNRMLKEAGGLSYLAALANETPSAANVIAYADIVREQSVLRQMMRTGFEIQRIAAAPGSDVDEKLSAVQALAMQLTDNSGQRAGSVRLVGTVLHDVVDALQNRKENGGGISGLTTGYSDLDSMSDGLHQGELIIIAGRPSMGKTTLAMNITENAAIKHKVPAAVFSMEMSTEQLTERMICSVGRVDYSRFRTGQLDDDEWAAVTRAMGLIKQATIAIDELPSCSLHDLRTRARRLKREHDLGLIVVDYLQLMEVPGTRENRATEISEISRGLKALAKELRVPVVALSQLNRNLEQRQNKRPMMADLRESGAIEQDADNILLLYRDEVYDPKTPDKGLAELIIGKQRNGPTGTVHLAFRGQFLRFDSTTRRACEHDQRQPIRNKWNGGFDYEAATTGGME